MNISRFSIIFSMGLVALVGLANNVNAATVGLAGAQGKTAKPETPPVKPKGAEIVSESWNLGCKPSGASGKLLCEISRTITLKETGNVLLSVFITPWEQSQATTPFLLRLQLPHGLNLPAGIQMQIDKGEQNAAAFQTTNQNGVFARTGLSKKMLASLQAGKILNVSFSGINGNKISVPVPLNGFTAVFAKMK